MHQPRRFLSARLPTATLLSALWATVAACSGSSPACDAGAVKSCSCPGGRSSTQSCRPGDAGYGPCECGSDASIEDVPVGDDVPIEDDDVPIEDDATVPEDTAAGDGPVCQPQCRGRTCGSNGCGGSCGECNVNFDCSSNGVCELDPAGRWIVTVVRGTVSERKPNGDAWDPFNGRPDPRVCVTINSERRCTATRDDTLEPVWNYQFPSLATTAGLQAGVRIEYGDDDLNNTDTIFDTTEAPRRAEFESGVWSIRPVSHASVTIRLMAR